jgi:hypothetical protein
MARALASLPPCAVIEKHMTRRAVRRRAPFNCGWVAGQSGPIHARHCGPFSGPGGNFGRIARRSPIPQSYPSTVAGDSGDARMPADASAGKGVPGKLRRFGATVRTSCPRHRVCILVAGLALSWRKSMPYVDQRKVNEAIRDCLRSCYRTRCIPARIAVFLFVLKAQGGWNEAELRQVEIGVRRVLCGILDGATDPGDTKNKPGSQSSPDDYRSKLSGG